MIKMDKNQNWLIDVINKNPNGKIFPLVFHGNIYASNKKTKKPCRATIIIPNDLDDTTNLKFLDNWKFLVIAIPKKEMDKSE